MGISVANVNCTADLKLCSDYNVTSYPALRIFRGPKNVTRFREKRKAKALVSLDPSHFDDPDLGSIISYMLTQILPKVSTVTKENIEELRSIDMPLVIAFVEESDETSSALFKSIASEHQDQALFGISHDLSLSKTAIAGPPFIIFHCPLDHIERILNGPFDSSKIGSFLGNLPSPLIGKFSVESYFTYTQVSIIRFSSLNPRKLASSPNLQSELPLLHIFATTEQERQSLAETLQHVAEKYVEKMNFATIDAEAYGFFAKALGVTLGHFPALVIEDVMSGDTVPFDQNEEITPDTVGKFVERYFGTEKSVKLNAQVRHCWTLVLLRLLILSLRMVTMMNCRSSIISTKQTLRSFPRVMNVMSTAT